MTEPMTDRPFVPYSALMAKVGYFLFYWSSLEQALTQAILEQRRKNGQASHRICGTFVERLNIWCELARGVPGNDPAGTILSRFRWQAMSLRDIRNNVVHGLKGGNSMPQEGVAHIECLLGGYDNPSGKSVSYSIDDLDHFTQAIDACRRAVLNLDAFNCDLDPRHGPTFSDGPALP